MDRSRFHHRIPVLGRPYLQRDEARIQRDQALKQRDEHVAESQQLQRYLRQSYICHHPHHQLSYEVGFTQAPKGPTIDRALIERIIAAYNCAISHRFTSSDLFWASSIDPLKGEIAKALHTLDIKAATEFLRNPSSASLFYRLTPLSLKVLECNLANRLIG